ncbi:hypothetical protein P3T73_05955 [Kiritimatiellota bacterium B12222]|nr:hypothetical protein P3T73_05955 [Kiritimatiellota bacterium B12222]
MKSTLVKTFLVLNLLLCAAVLGVSVKQFMDREVVKAGTVVKRQKVEEIAKNLNWGATLPWENPADRMTGSFLLPDPQNLNELESFTTQLEALSDLAETRLSQLNEEYTELEGVLIEYETAKSDLTEREAELEQSRRAIAALEVDLSDAKKELKNGEADLATLERQQNALDQQVQGLDAQITAQLTQISDVEAQLVLREGERDRIQALLEACRRPQNGPTEKTIWHEQTAQILAVEKEWNYVVINRGEVDVLPMYLEAFVHRGDQFIGKIRVMQVDRTVALAEVLQDTMAEGETIKAGDTIFF